MRLQDFDTGERYQARILSNTPITAPGAAEEVLELTLEVERADFDYAIGQSVGVIVEGPFDQAGRADLEPGPDAYFLLMGRLADQLAACLQDPPGGSSDD